MIARIKKIIPNKVKRELRLILNKGDIYVCPFCHYQAKNLSPTGLSIPVLKEKEVIGGGYRLGGCFKCGSTDRERLIYLYLDKVYKLFGRGKEIKILHIAPEKTLSDVLLNQNFKNYVCGDLFTPGYNYPEHVINLNVLSIPFDDNYFDLIICNHVLEHIPNDIDAIKEIYRVLRNGGIAILQVPISKNSEVTFEDFSITDPKEREIVFGQFDHVRIYGQDYPTRLEKSGFKVERINISENYDKFGLNKEEDIFIGKK